MEVVQQADAVAEVVGKCYVYLSLFKHHVYHLDVGGVLTALVVKDVSYKGIDKRAVRHGVKGLDDKTGAVKVGVCGGNSNAFDIAVNRSYIILLVEVILGGDYKSVFKFKTSHRLDGIGCGALEKRSALVEYCGIVG